MRILLPLLTFVFLFSADAAVELIKNQEDYFLKGSCEETAAEIRHFSTKPEIFCQCSDTGCLTKINEHLPADIKELVENPINAFDGPNCWNSVLFSLGLHQGLHYSESDIKHWLASPLCQMVEGQPSPGDLINVVGYSPYNGEVEEFHTYRLLSPSVAFNKSSPDKNDPYEITGPYEYLDRDKMPAECRFVNYQQATKNKCQISAVAYRCKNLDSVLTDLQPNSSETAEKLKHLSECSQRAVLGEPQPFEDLAVMAQALQQLALKELGFPADEEFPSSLKEKLSRYVYDTCPNCGDYREDDWMGFVPQIYFFSSPDMKLDAFAPSLQAIILEVREQKMYSKLPVKDRLMWANVWLTSDGLEKQFNMFSSPNY